MPTLAHYALIIARARHPGAEGQDLAMRARDLDCIRPHLVSHTGERWVAHYPDGSRLLASGHPVYWLRDILAAARSGKPAVPTRRESPRDARTIIVDVLLDLMPDAMHAAASETGSDVAAELAAINVRFRLMAMLPKSVTRRRAREAAEKKNAAKTHLALGLFRRPQRRPRKKDSLEN